MGSGDKKKPGVNFDLEPDADDIFRQFLDENEPVSPKSDPEERPLKAPKASKPPKVGSLEIDLHGMTLPEAKRELVAAVDRLIASSRGQVKVRVITGKGRHSGPGGGVLVRQIYDFFQSTYGAKISRIDSDPGDSMVEGLPLRGHFDALLKL